MNRANGRQDPISRRTKQKLCCDRVDANRYKTMQGTGDGRKEFVLLGRLDGPESVTGRMKQNHVGMI